MTESKRMDVIIHIERCPRCGETHINVVVKPFTSVGTDGTEHLYWATCPKTQEPILVKFELK